MDYDDKRVVSAFYETRSAADTHQRALEDLGVPASDITIVEGADEAEPDRAYEEKGFFESIGDFFMGDEDRNVYNEGLKRGGYLLTARVAEAHYDGALDVLDTDEAVDLDVRSETWRAEGWDGTPAGAGAMGAAGTVDTGVHAERYDNADAAPAYDTSGAGTMTGATAGTTQRGDGDLADGTIEVMEENVRIGKRDTSHGRVRVRSYVVEDQVSEDVTLRSEHVDIERRPVDRAVEPGTAAFQERTIEAEETAEEAVVSKDARVTEEIDLRKRSDTDVETVTETVRHTEVEVEDDRDGGAVRRDDRTPL